MQHRRVVLVNVAHQAVQEWAELQVQSQSQTLSQIIATHLEIAACSFNVMLSDAVLSLAPLFKQIVREQIAPPELVDTC